MKYLLFYMFLFSLSPLLGQENWDFDNKEPQKKLFLDTRAVNGHTANTLEEKVLDFRITHRFGEIATPQSYRTLFGFDNSTDIRIALEYGITEKLMVGFGRCKGAGPYLEFWDTFLKYNLISSSDKKFKATLNTKLFYSSMASSSDISSIIFFDKAIHRISYHSEILLAYQVHQKVAIQLSPGFSYRNLTNAEDENLLLDLASTAKVHLFKKVSLMLEHFWIINANEYRKESYQNPFGIGIEINTFAHVFQLNFMNSKGLGAGQFIPLTTSNWSEGEFRFGFTIARKFNL